MVKTRSTGEKLFNIINGAVLFFVILVAVYPLYYMTIISISHGLEVMKGNVVWVPKLATLDTYKTIVKGDLFMYMKNTVVYTVVGTAINLFMCCLCAYPLSRRTFSGRKVFTTIIVVTMFFSGGMIPLYLVINSLGMIDTIWSLVLPVAINTYNMIIIRTSFQAIPDSLVESMQLDGANDFTILMRLVIPLSKAVLATMLLFFAVSHWNSYFEPMLYLNSKSRYPLQIMLRNMLISGLFTEESSVAGGAVSFSVTDATLRAAAIMVTTLPILVVYPFVQRYFVKGIMIGSLKG